MTADDAPDPPPASTDGADGAGDTDESSDRAGSIRFIRRPPATGRRRRAAPSNARSTGPIRSIDVIPLQGAPVPATGPVPVQQNPDVPVPMQRIDDDEGVDDVVAGPVEPRRSTGPLEIASRTPVSLDPPATADRPVPRPGEGRGRERSSGTHRASAQSWPADGEVPAVGGPVPADPDPDPDPVPVPDARSETPTSSAGAAGPTTDELAIAHGRRRSMSRHARSRDVPASRLAAWSGRRGAWVASLVPALALTAVLQWWSGSGYRLPAGVARFGPAGGFAVLQPGALSGHRFFDGRTVDAPPLAWLQSGLVTRALTDLTGASAFESTRVGQLLLALIGVALVWRIVRRAPSSALAAFAAAALTGAAPMAIAVHTQPVPISIAVVWLLGACALAQSTPSVQRAAAVGACIAVAVLTAPWAALGAIAPLWLLVRASTRRGPGVRAVLVGILGGVVVLAAAVAAAAALQSAPVGAGSMGLERLADAAARLTSRPSIGVASWRAWVSTDPLGLLVGAIALGAAVPRRRLLPVVVPALLVAAAAVVPLGGDPLTAPTLLLPALAILAGAAVDPATALLGRPVLAQSVVGAGWLMGLVAVLVVAGVQWGAGLHDLARTADGPVADARRWVGASVPPGDVVLVALAVWPDLARDARASIGWYTTDAGDAAGAPTSTPWQRADYVVADSQLRQHASGEAATVLRRSVDVRTFGSGTSALQVRAVPAHASAKRPAGPAPTRSPAERAAAAERTRIGGELARNPRIVLHAADRVLLQRGQVDQRVAVVVGQLLAAHAVTVAAFPMVPGDPADPRRQVLISGLDGHAIPEDIQRTGILLRYLSSLRGSFSTSRIDATPNGVLATFGVGSTR